MWSRLTEYAEKGLAEMVAPAADGVNKEEDELWTRFTSIVAPPAAEPSEDKKAPPSATPPSSSSDGGAKAALEAEDEQEQYIYELERALLQRKKQNEALEAKVRELEARGPVGDGQTEERLKLQLRQQEAELAELKAERQALLQSQQEHAMQATHPLVSKVEVLEARLAELQSRCGAVRARLDGERQLDGATRDHNEEDNESSIFPMLVQIALQLGSMVSSEMPAVSGSEEEITTQILSLTKQTKLTLESKVSRLQVLEKCVGSFLARHGEQYAMAATVEDELVTSQLQSRFGVLSHRLAKADEDIVQLKQVRERVEAAETDNDSQMKKILQLQAQINSMQASKQRSDRSLQQIATKEMEMAEVINAKDQEIAKLDSYAEKMKAKVNQLVEELENVHLELDEVMKRSQTHTQQVASLQSRILELESNNKAIQDENHEVRSSAAEYEQGYMNLLSEFEQLKQQTQAEKAEILASTEAHAESADSQAMYELESRLKAAEADKVVALQDAERLQNDVNALEGVLHEFQLNSKIQKERVVKLEAELEEAKSAQKMTKSAGVKEDDDFERVMAVLAKKTRECDQLREALENAASHHSSERDILDKRLAAQLVVAYIDSDKKGEVLQLMARMMGFSEDQKRRVGLGYAIEGNGGGGLFSSIIGLVAPPDSQASAPAIEGKSFAEMWTEFLVDEASKK